jgi:hypothetical protein
VKIKKKMKRFTIIAQTSYRNGEREREREREKRQKNLSGMYKNLFFFLLQKTCWFELASLSTASSKKKEKKNTIFMIFRQRNVFGLSISTSSVPNYDGRHSR